MDGETLRMSGVQTFLARTHSRTQRLNPINREQNHFSWFSWLEISEIA
jgi:hypothetical protein